MGCHANAKSFHPHRVARRHLRDRDPDGHPHARPDAGQGAGQTHGLRQSRPQSWAWRTSSTPRSPTAGTSPSWIGPWASDFYWPANQLFRRLLGYKDKQGPGDSDWNAPKEYLCPSDLVSIQERQDSQYTSWLSYGGNLTDWYFRRLVRPFRYAGQKNTSVGSPASELFFTESNDWWLHWKGANYEKGWDVLGHDTIMPYKNVGCDGPILYRHGEGVNIAFYDGHVEYMKKDKVWSQDDWDRGIARHVVRLQEVPADRRREGPPAPAVRETGRRDPGRLTLPRLGVRRSEKQKKITYELVKERAMHLRVHAATFQRFPTSAPRLLSR